VLQTIDVARQWLLVTGTHRGLDGCIEKSHSVISEQTGTTRGISKYSVSTTHKIHKLSSAKRFIYTDSDIMK